MQDFTAKDFLSQLGNIAEKSEMSEVSTVASTNPSPTPSLHLANFFNENGVVTMRNLQAMAMCNALASQGKFLYRKIALSKVSNKVMAFIN